MEVWDTMFSTLGYVLIADEEKEITHYGSTHRTRAYQVR